ncbi:MAG: SAM-dependent methyltransferase [Vicingaceae bacterium]
MKIDKKAIPFILFQRTQYIEKSYIHKAVAKFFRVFSSCTSLNSILKANDLLSRDSIRSVYHNDMVSEFESIKNELPESAENVLDIGCGIAGIDILISRHYGHKVNICLLDKSTIDNDLHYGFEKRGSFYNSLALSKKVLVDNGVHEANVFVQEATNGNTINFDKKFDLIISIISWGFHYPVEVYLDQVYSNLNTGGLLILDVRKESSGLEQLINKFGNHNIVKEFEKHFRVKLIK